MKSLFSIFIAILFCFPTAWGQKTEKPRTKHADMFVFLEDGPTFKGVLYETLDDAILLMPYKQLVKKNGKLFLTASSSPVKIPIADINRVLVKPNFYNKGYGIGILVGAAGAFGVMGATMPDELKFENSYAIAPIVIISSFTVAPIVGAIHRESGKVNIVMSGDQDAYERNRELLNSFIYFPNTDYELFKPQNQKVIEVARNSK